MLSGSLTVNKLLNFWWSLCCCCCCCCCQPMANRKLLGSARAADALASVGSPSARKPSGQRRANGTLPSAANPWSKSRAAAEGRAAVSAGPADIREPARRPAYSIRGMNDEDVRLQTFLNSWSTRHQLGPIELARNGFFRKGSGAADDDLVQCAFCHLVIESKHLGNRIHDQHLLSSPSCRLARGERTNNMPAPATIQYRQHVDPCRTQPSMQTPKFPDYCTASSRRSSFVNWRGEPSSSRLAEAGFFYKGPEDMVTCFCCGQSLRDWRPTDDPFIEHARWSKECHFLLETKGYDFVIAVGVAMADVSGPRGEVHPVSEVLEAQKLPGERTRAYDVTGHERLPAEHPASQHGLGSHSAAAAPGSATAATRIQLGNDVVFGGLPGVLGSRSTLTAQPQSTVPSVTSHNESANAEQLRDRLTCKICMDRQVCITFRPCGHLCVCQECAASLSSCPMCRGRIQERQLTFLS